MDDVIFPIIGHKVKMPTNPDMRKMIEDIMEKDGMSMAKFNSHASLVSTSATGSYRKIVQKASNVQFDIVESNDPNEDLLTPYYIEQQDPATKLIEGAPVTKALRVKFSLKPSSYATMFLREVTRTSSAFDNQLKISNLNK